MNNILISYVGSADPYANNYDGSIVHILRNYQNIDEVYLLYSAEFWELEQKKSLFSMGFKAFCERNNREISFENILLKEDIEIDDYDAYYEHLGVLIKTISKDNPDKGIILNISSGSPAMKVTMLMSAMDIIDVNCLCVQVRHPEQKADRGLKVINENYDLLSEIENNFDELPETDTRCREPKFYMYFKQKTIERIISLIKTYNYKLAYEIYQEHNGREDILMLINHARKRSELTEESVENIKEIKNRFSISCYPIGDAKVREIVDYFLILRNLEEVGKISEFVVRLPQLVVKLQSRYLEKDFDFDVLKICDSISMGKNQALKINREKFSQNYPKCHHDLNSDYKYGVEETTLSISFLNKIIKHYKQKKHESKYKDFVFFEEVNKERNIIAHQLYCIDAENHDNKIIPKLENLIKYLYSDYNLEDAFNIYRVINENIIKNL